MIQYSDIVKDERSQLPIQGAEVFVYTVPDQNGDAPELATIYAADGVTPVSNPVITNNLGVYSFYNPAGELVGDVYVGARLRYRSRLFVGGGYSGAAQSAAAAAASAVGAPAYPNTAAGIAGTALNETFWVDNGDGTGTTYRHDAGPVATEIGKFVKDQTASGAASLLAGGVPTTADLASSSGAGLVGIQRSGGIARNVGGVLLETWRVTDFMTEAQVADVTSGTGAIDVTAAIQAAIDGMIAAGGGTLVFPKGMHLITDEIVVNTTDASVCVWLVGSGRNTVIRQTGAGKDAIRWSDANWLYGGGIRDMQIRCTATAGHCFNVGYGMANALLSNVGFIQANPGKSVIYGDFPNANAGGIIGCRFSGGVWHNAATSTVNAVKISCNGQVFGENIFENISLYYANSVAFFDIGTKSGLTGYWLENNYFRNLYFELCPGGAFRCDTSNKWTFDGIRMWDTTSFTNHIFEFTAGLSGTEARAVRISNYTRLGGTMASGKYDIKIADGHDAVIDNIGMETAHSPMFDFGSKRVTVIGRAIGTFDNALSTMFVGNSTGGIRFRGAANGAYLNYYDEGTWTATLSGTGAAPTTPVTVSGDWTRIGRRVSASAKFSSVDTTGASGGVVISGLPFAVNASQEPVNVAHMIGMGTTAAVAKATASTISLYRMTSGTAIAHADGTPGPGKSITVSLEYIV